MKISVCSDLHLEFGDLDLYNEDNSDVLVLSGDVCVARDLVDVDQSKSPENYKSARFHEFFQRCCVRWRTVVYVMGNHEHYHGDFALTLRTLRKNLSYLANLYILERNSFVLGDVAFVGGTLWTDMNKEDPQTMHRVRNSMNDFRIVEDSERPATYRDQQGSFHTRQGHFSPQRAVEEHKLMMEYLTRLLDLGYKSVVVCTHHAPSRQSTHPRYAKDFEINGAYSSELSEFILDHPEIRLWTHGHTHEEFDYLIGSTRIVCNPRGYDGYEIRASRFELVTVEI